MLLCVGGHYTYARVPFFNWIQPFFGWHRNHFDRLGHFAQGFVPALIARELFIRLRVVTSGGWRFAIIDLSSAWESVRFTNCSNGARRSPRGAAADRFPRHPR